MCNIGNNILNVVPKYVDCFIFFKQLVTSLDLLEYY